MSASNWLAALVAAATLAAPMSAGAADDFVRASSNGPTLLKLCGKDSPVDDAVCKSQPYDALAGRMEQALQAALAKAPANVRPLLKRDQAWFNEMVVNIAQSMQLVNPDPAGTLVTLLKQRTETLATIAPGLSRPGFAGRWVDAFGSVTVTPAEHGAYRLAVDAHSDYAAGDETLWDCHFTAEVAPAGDGWLKGMIAGQETSAATKAADGTVNPAPKRIPLKMRRQGETLRVVVDSDSDGGGFACRRIDQVAASYFASGAGDAAVATDKADTSVVAPTFDCTRPGTATEEEICADPELAENDVRLNRAWKTLSPRLDDTTRRALTEDQRNWVKAQIWQYPEQLHPAWAKRTYFMHHTVDGRQQLKSLQRERLALLEGFDEGRKGFVGLWLGYTAILKVSMDGDDVKAEGGKWFQGDWKGGCEFDMTGKVTGGAFRSDGDGVNPDTLERDHATLIVNRRDDVFARKRSPENGKGDEPKCSRNPTISSTTRLFPVRPSPDIDEAQKSIR
jgi:uncharacterized protein YecT (DUF1311 family)